MLNQGNGQLCAVYRHIDLLQDIRQGADMVLMAMGNNEALHLVNVLL